MMLERVRVVEQAADGCRSDEGKVTIRLSCKMSHKNGQKLQQ